MSMDRRSFFSMIGAGSAAKAAGIPEPERVESLEKGGIYAVHVDYMDSYQYEDLVEYLRDAQERLGVKFIVFTPAVTGLTKLEPPKKRLSSFWGWM